MNTITTKQLRDSMPEVIRTLRNGHPVTLTYRHKEIGTIQPYGPGLLPLRRGSAQAVRQAFAVLDFDVPAEVSKDPRSIKDQIAELRDRDLR